MHTRHDAAQVIPGKGAGCVMTVEATTPALHKQLQKLPRATVPAVSAGHARLARRATKAAQASAWTELEGATQAPQSRRTVTKKGNKTDGGACPVVSDRDADPATLAARARSHRETENRLHGVRDVNATLPCP
jgi:hypothetical protein